MSFNVFNQLGMIFILILIGFAVRKIEIITEELEKGLSSIVLSVALPCTILSSANTNYNPALAKNAVTVFIGAFIYFALAILLSIIYIKKSKFSRKTVFSSLLIFSNASFLGYPIVSSFLPETGIFYAVVFCVVFNFSFFTFGKYIILGKESISVKSMFTDINLIASVLMLFLFSLQIKLPAVIQQTLSAVGAMTTPLSLIVIGSMLASLPLKDIFKDKSLYAVSALRLVVCPLVTFAMLKLLQVDKDAATILLIMSALPSGALTAITAASGKNQKSAAYATKGVLLTTLLFAGTIFLLVLLQSML